MAAQKRDGNCSRLVVTGCLAERYRDELRKEIPEIDACARAPVRCRRSWTRSGTRGWLLAVRSSRIPSRRRCR
jgi:hypothetical protein